MGALWSFLLFLPFASSASGQEVYDVLIRGGRVLDGSGNPFIKADVGLRGDTVAAIGDLSEASAARTVDASGKYVVPGFADVVVLDPDRLRDKATYFEPFQFSEGIDQVWVNGTLVVDGGKPTAARPGRVLSRQRAGT